MDRSSLEQLLMQQLLRGSLSDIDLALTSSGSEEGSLGMLDVLSEDLLIMVLRHVDNTPSLLKICTVLSKRLRSLRYNQSLWQSLEVYNSGFSETGLRQLVQWLPDCGVVRSLALRTCGHHNWGDAPAAEFVASFGAVERLKLTGDLKASLVACLGRLKFESVRDFHFDPPGSLGDKHGLKLVTLMPRLSVLKLSDKQLTDNLVHVASVRRLCPLLEELHQVGGTSWTDQLTVTGLELIGKAFPQLRVLKVCVCVPEDQHLLFAAGAFDETLATMPKLETLHLRRLCPFSGPHLTSRTLSKLVGAVARACPVVRELSIKHGRKYMSGPDLKREGGYPTLPTLSVADWSAAVSGTVESIRLTDMDMGISLTDAWPAHLLPKLASLRLENCPGAPPLVAALVERCPALTEAACVLKQGRARW